MRTAIVAATVLLGACASEEPAASDAGPDARRGGGAAVAEWGEFVALDPSAWTLDGGEHCAGCATYGASDSKGDLGCRVASDFAAAEPSTGRVFARLDPGFGFDFGCHATYVFDLRPPDECDELELDGQLSPGCAVYQRWDADGAMAVQALARAGAVSYTPLDDRATGCVLSVSTVIEFAGATYRASHTYPLHVVDPPLCGD